MSRQKMGRPPQLGERRADVYPVRLPDEIIAAIDAYREREGLTRSEAFRQLIEIALFETAKKRAPKRNRTRREEG